MQVNVEEALRYLGAGGPTPPALRAQAETVAEELAATLEPRFVYKVCDLRREGDAFAFEGTPVILTGHTASRMLAQCDRGVLLACTLGAAFDARLRALRARDMAKAVIWDACGSAYVEQGCDRAEAEIAARFPGLYLTDRFSPGYGDLPLALQRDFSTALDMERRLGVHVSENFFMTPVKTVTALIGLSDRPQMARIRGCDYCALREHCQLRKGGKRCGM